MRIQSIQWDIDVTNKLHFLTNNGQYHSMTWSWTSQVSSSNTRSLVFLIDGCHLFVSDFTHSSIPPPMFSYEIVCSTNILAVTSDDDQNQLLLVLSDRSLAICQSSPHRITSVVPSSESPIKELVHATHFRLLNNRFYFIENDHLHQYDLQTKIKQSFPMNFQCLTTAIEHEESKHLYFQDEQGKIFRLENDQLHAKMHFPRPCAQFSVLLNGQFLGLTENYRLYLNTNELAHNCNSYFIHDRTILVYSTLQHQLAFRSLINEQLNSEISYRRTGNSKKILRATL